MGVPSLLVFKFQILRVRKLRLGSKFGPDLMKHRKFPATSKGDGDWGGVWISAVIYSAINEGSHNPQHQASFL